MVSTIAGEGCNSPHPSHLMNTGAELGGPPPAPDLTQRDEMRELVKEIDQEVADSEQRRSDREDK
jgi:hypothetical protein